MSGLTRFRAFVGNIPWTIGSEELKLFASTFGQVQHARVIFDKNTGLNKGFGFVIFTNRESLELATRTGGYHELEGSRVQIQLSTQ